jgi:hypothetical protein
MFVKVDGENSENGKNGEKFSQPLPSSKVYGEIGENAENGVNGEIFSPFSPILSKMMIQTSHSLAKIGIAWLINVPDQSLYSF